MNNNENTIPWKPPTMAELMAGPDAVAEPDVLATALGMEPPPCWVKEHPVVHVRVEGAGGQPQCQPLQYVPLHLQRLLARRLLGPVRREILREAVMFHSVVVTVRLHYVHPITGQELYADGIGAMPVLAGRSVGAASLARTKPDAVMRAAPAAAALAEKNAYDTLGRIFGGELQKNALLYAGDAATADAGAMKQRQAVAYGELRGLYALRADTLTADENRDARRILDNREENNYGKLRKLLQRRQA